MKWNLIKWKLMAKKFNLTMILSEFYEIKKGLSLINYI